MHKKNRSVSDPWITLIALLVTVVGVLAIWDAGYSRAAANGMVIPRELAFQAGYGIAALMAGLLASKVSPDILKRIAPWVAVSATLLLLAVELPGIGKEINFARRWIAFGPITIQPSELCKLSSILLLSWYVFTWKPMTASAQSSLASRLDRFVSYGLRYGWPIVLLIVSFIFLEREKDLGTALILVSALLAILAVSNFRPRVFVVCSTLVVGLCCLLVTKEGYRSDRIQSHLHRWEAGRRDSIGYQTTQSEIALARGGILGVGFGGGRAKHNLPAPTTDFVLATIGEEFGFVGSSICVLLLAALSVRLLWIGLRQRDLFARSVHVGVGTWLGIQTGINVMMVNGTLPPVGVPLPFITYGGSSLLALWVALGVCQSLQGSGSEVVEESSESDRNRGRYGRARLSGA